MRNAIQFGIVLAGAILLAPPAIRSDDLIRTTEIDRVSGSSFIAIAAAVPEFANRLKGYDVAKYEIVVFDQIRDEDRSIGVWFHDPAAPPGLGQPPSGFLPSLMVEISTDGQVIRSYFDR